MSGNNQGPLLLMNAPRKPNGSLAAEASNNNIRASSNKNSGATNPPSLSKNLEASVASITEQLNKVAGLAEKLSEMASAGANTLKANVKPLSAAAGNAAEAAAGNAEVVAAANTSVGTAALAAVTGSNAAANAAQLALTNGVAGPAVNRAVQQGSGRFLTETVKQLRQFSGLARSTAKAMRGGMQTVSRMASQASSKVEGTVQQINSRVPHAVQQVNSLVSQMGGKPSNKMPKIGSNVVKTLKSVFKAIAKQAAAVGKAKPSKRAALRSKIAKGKQDGGFFSLF